jgi:hypothetical protein
MSGEELLGLADAVLQADRILDRMPEIVPPGRNRELLLVPIEGAPVLAKALKVLLEGLWEIQARVSGGRVSIPEDIYSVCNRVLASACESDPQ